MESKDFYPLAISAAALIVSVVNFIVARKSVKRAQVKNNSEETQKAYNDWFSMEYYNLRRNYQITFTKIKNIEDWQQRELEDLVQGKELETIKQMHYFFDKIGWLANAGLIDTNYILCPTKLWVTKTWNDLKPFIEIKRVNDPIHGLGHEQLAKYVETKRFQKFFYMIWKLK